MGRTGRGSTNTPGGLKTREGRALVERRQLSFVGSADLSASLSASPDVVGGEVLSPQSNPLLLRPRQDIVSSDDPPGGDDGTPGSSPGGLSLVGLWAIILMAALLVILLIFTGICWWRFDWRPRNTFAPYRVVVRTTRRRANAATAGTAEDGRPREGSTDSTAPIDGPVASPPTPSPPQTSEANCPAVLFYPRVPARLSGTVPNQNPPMMLEEDEVFDARQGHGVPRRASGGAAAAAAAGGGQSQDGADLADYYYYANFVYQTQARDVSQPPPQPPPATVASEAGKSGVPAAPQ